MKFETGQDLLRSYPWSQKLFFSITLPSAVTLGEAHDGAKTQQARSASRGWGGALESSLLFQENGRLILNLLAGRI